MKYVVMVTETCLEGGIVGREAWLAETEDEMKAMVDACRFNLCGLSTEVTPVVEPGPFCKEKIAERLEAKKP